MFSVTVRIDTGGDDPVWFVVTYDGQLLVRDETDRKAKAGVFHSLSLAQWMFNSALRGSRYAENNIDLINIVRVRD